jgi:thiol-disulfide isomerase/thioredoxin
MDSTNFTADQKSTIFPNRMVGMIVFVAVLVAGVAWIAMTRVEPRVADHGDLAEAPVPGYRAPDFALPAVNGETMALHAVDRPVVLNFWATWCAPCRAEMPAFQRISQRYGDQVAVIGVNQREESARVTSFALEMGVNYPLLLDQDGSVNQTYQVRALPTTIFIDADGVVQEVFTGIITEGALQEKIERHLLSSAR